MSRCVTDVYCPMMKKEIETGYCEELQMIADDAITPMKEEHLTKKDFEICYNCKKRIDPRL